MPHQCTNCGHTFPDGSKEMLSGCPDCGGNKFQFAPSTTLSESNADSSGAQSDESEDVDGVASRAAETVRGWVSSNSTDESTESTEPTPVRTEKTAQPSSDRQSTPEPTADTGGFTEWPDSARRPEDRSAVADQPSTDDDGDVESSNTRADGSLADQTDTAALESSEDSAQASARSEVVPTDDLPTGTDLEDGTDMITTVGGTETDSEQGTDQPPANGRVVSEPSGEQPSMEELRAELNDQFESIKIVRPGQYELNLMELYNRDEHIISLQEDGRYVIDVPDSWRDDAGE